MRQEGHPAFTDAFMRCTRGSINKYRGSTLQTTIATPVNAGVWTRVDAEVAVTTTLEEKHEIDGVPALH